jgi:hypothetical protein
VVSGLSACWCSRNAGKGGYVAIGFRHTSPKRKRGSPPRSRFGLVRLPYPGSVGRCDTRLVALLPEIWAMPFAQPLIFTPSTQLNSVHRTSAPGAGSRGRETPIYGQYAGNFPSVAAWYAARPAMGRRRSKARSKSANSSKCSVLSSRRTARLDAGVFLLRIFLNQTGVQNRLMAGGRVFQRGGLSGHRGKGRRSPDTIAVTALALDADKTHSRCHKHHVLSIQVFHLCIRGFWMTNHQLGSQNTRGANVAGRKGA